jgi:AraC family ethanolamine operon transcriptional activator
MHPASRSGSRRTLSREAVVERAELYLRANAGPIPVPQLCRIVGLSERGLRNAFQSVRGMSPTRSMLHARLLGVRRELSGQHDVPVTVTDVAVRFGFYELGRFAAAYRRAFGEAPSETLRASRHGQHGR